MGPRLVSRGGEANLTTYSASKAKLQWGRGWLVAEGKLSADMRMRRIYHFNGAAAG